MGWPKGKPSWNKGNGLSIVERFWKRVNKTEKCWEWTGDTFYKEGYGRIRETGHGGPSFSTHRLSWELHYGPIPVGLEVLHKCDNKICVRPDHLFLGTQKDNMQDCSQKGRLKPGHVPGEKSGTAKLTWEVVRNIRARYQTGVYSKRLLGRLYGVDHRNIKFIVEGKTWKPEYDSTKEAKHEVYKNQIQ
jgi:hypothetical protein